MPAKTPQTARKPASPSSPVVRLFKQLNAPLTDPAADPDRWGRDTLTIRRMHGPHEACYERDVYERDVEAWLSIQNAAFGRRRPWTRADFQRALERRGGCRVQRVWLAIPAAAEGPVGTIALELSGTPLAGRLQWLAVDSAWRRRGIGHRLVRQLERECWQRGGRHVELETLGSWHAAMGLYQSLGYRERRSLGSAGYSPASPSRDGNHGRAAQLPGSLECGRW